jgi:tetratricopeptide (TPR) repeat protein
MVPPAPHPDDAHLGHDDDWLERVGIALHLRREGLVMQINAVQDAAAGPLITRLEAGPGPLLVLDEAGAMGQAPTGSVIVLLKSGEWPHWLNQLRAVVNKRQLLLLLWCTDEDRAILKRQAPDFYDWISLRVTIPPTQPGYVQRALAAVAETGGVLALRHAPAPAKGFTPLQLGAGYAALRAALGQGDVWLSGVTAADELLTARVAHAEAQARGHAGALVLADPGALTPTMTALDARPLPWAEAITTLKARGVAEPGLVAARADLNPHALLDEVPLGATLIQNPDWDALLDLVRAGVGAEALGLAERLGLVGVAAVWRGEGVMGGVPNTLLGTYSPGMSVEGLLQQRADSERAGDEGGAAVAALRLADLMQQRGEPDEALRLLREEVLPVFERLGDEHHRAVTLSLIADVLQAWGQLDEALQIRREEVLPVFKRPGDILHKAVTLSKIADVLQIRGQLDEALQIFRYEVLPVLERLGDVRSRAVTRGKIADVLQAKGQLDEALRIRREEELPVYERLGDERSVAVTRGKFADVLQLRGQLDEALRVHREEVLPIFERLGDVHRKAITMGKIAEILQARGQLDEALQIYRLEQLPVYDRLGDVREKAITNGRIADIFQARGQLDDALRIQREDVLPVYERLGDVRNKAATMYKIAALLHARGQLDEPLRILRDLVLPVYERLGDMRSSAGAMTKLAEILVAQGQLDDALRILRNEVLPALTTLGDQHALLVTQANLAVTLLRTQKPEHRPEAITLLTAALTNAVALNLPLEAEQLRDVFRYFNLPAPH